MTQPLSDLHAKPSVLSIRVRLTLIAAVVVALVLGISGAGVVLWQHRSIIDQQQARLTTEAASVALAVSQGKSYSNIVRPGTGVQVVSSSGVVISSTDILQGEAPVATYRPPSGARANLKPSGSTKVAGDDGVQLLNAETISTNHGAVTIYTMTFGSHIENSTRSLIIGLAIALPLTLILLGVLIWILIGLALRPIERMRSSVAVMAEDELDLRVPVPPGDDEVARLAVTLNEMLDRLEGAQRKQRGFISDASHELRSPIASLLATVEVASARPENANWPAVASVVIAEGQRLGRLVDDLLMLAASDERRDIHRRQAVDLEELLFAEAERLRLQGTVRVEVSSISAVRVLGDPLQLDRAVRNIVDNAVRHAAGIVEFRLFVDEDVAHLRVSDDGPGIASEDADRLFERFSRLDNSRDRFSGGTGLGLAIVASVMQAHGGNAQFIASSKGATVELTLPIFETGANSPIEAEVDPLLTPQRDLQPR